MNFMSVEDGDVFNPNEFTEKELIKLIYRDLHNLKNEFEEYKRTNTTQKDMAELEKRVFILENDKKESEKRNKSLIAVVGITLAAMQVAIKLLWG